MKIVFKGINHVFECGTEKISTIVIENQRLFYDIITDLENQIQGNDGKSVLSENDKILRIDKRLEQIMQFVPFDMNKKKLVNKIASDMQALAVDDKFMLQTNEVLATWERLCYNLEFDLPVHLEFGKINVETLIKATGLTIVDDYDSLAEKIVDYIQLVEEFDCKKMFVFINLRSFIDDEEMKELANMVIARGYQVLLLDNTEHPMLENEKRYIVDADMCEMCYNSDE